MDDPATKPEDIAGTFRDIARINRFLGGSRAVIAALTPLVTAAASKPNRMGPVRILDIGTGSADIPRAIADKMRAAINITATDAQPRVLELARSLTPHDRYPQISLEHADALALPYADGAFDIALCSLTLHHFRPDECVRILSEMKRVTTAGFIVNDLIRSPIAAFLVAFWSRLTFANHVTRHDAPASVRRAYLPHEYAEMARGAGVPGIEVRRVPIYRVVLIHRKNG